MEIHPAVLEGRSRHGLYRAVAQALITTHIGNAPTQIFMLGEDDKGELLAVSAIVRNEDILLYHAASADPRYLVLLDDTAALRGPADQPSTTDSYGRSADGLELTEQLVQRLFDAADSGYDVERLNTRTRPGRPAPLAVAGVVRAGLDEKLAHALTEHAAADGISADTLAETALRNYLTT